MLQGFTKEFSSLRALITHHSIMPELLPIPLSLPRPPQNNIKAEKDNIDDIDNYGCMNEFKKVMAA